MTVVLLVEIAFNVRMRWRINPFAPWRRSIIDRKSPLQYDTILAFAFGDETNVTITIMEFSLKNSVNSGNLINHYIWALW